MDRMFLDGMSIFLVLGLVLWLIGMANDALVFYILVGIVGMSAFSKAR